MKGLAANKRLLRAVGLTAAALAMAACGVALWTASPFRKTADLATLASHAYDSRDWAAALTLARQALAVRKDDLAAAKVLARASARLARDDAAMAIYQRRIDENRLEAEDYLLLGMIYQRRGRPDAALLEWAKAMEASQISPQCLEELGRLLIQAQKWESALQVTERLAKLPGLEARGLMMLGTIRVELNNMPGAAESFRRALELDPTEIDQSHLPLKLRKLIARTFLRMASPSEAETLLRPLLERNGDQEAEWLLSRVYLQQGDKARAMAALAKAGSYRAANPLEVDPGPYTGETRCEKCHANIYRDSLASRHTQTYYRGHRLAAVPLPGKPLADPDDPQVSHTMVKRDGILHEETRVGNDVFDAVIAYAFGTHDRYLTTISQDAQGGYHISRLSYYQSCEGKGWDRSTLDTTHPTRARPADFQGEPIGVRDGLAKCFYCHITNPRTGNDAMGPEIADRAIGCERCHGPGGNHIAALAMGVPDSAIVNPAGASPEAVTTKQCNDCHILQRNFEQDPENPGWIRSQGVGWSRSRCNTESGGTFGCVTCHNPHQTASATSKRDYEAKCKKCHAAPQKAADGDRSISSPSAGPPFRACPVNASEGCLGCHMPRVRIDSLHSDLTDHFIRVRGRKP